MRQKRLPRWGEAAFDARGDFAAGGAADQTETGALVQTLVENLRADPEITRLSWRERAAGARSVAALALGGQVLHINFGAALDDLARVRCAAGCAAAILRRAGQAAGRNTDGCAGTGGAGARVRRK